MNTEASIEIEAPTSVVWEVFTDAERWAQWTESVTAVRALDGPGIEIGKRFEIKQPKFPKLVWEVTAVEPGVSWTWRQRSPGGTTDATHVLEPLGDGRTLVRQVIDQQGPIGVLVGRLYRGLTVKYLDMEGMGLKSRSEHVAASA